jgi:RNase_H superfamily
MGNYQLPRILFVDIETAPNLATVWSIWNQNIGTNQLLESSYILCWSAKWKHEKKVMFDSTRKSGKSGVVKSIYKLLNEADIVIHYNGRRFDIPVLNREFLLLGLSPPVPYKQIDLYQTVKRKFMFVSNKLAYITEQLGFKGKIATTHQLWIDCMNNKPEAWRYMERYNKRDVMELEKVYKRLIPWIDQHPNRGLYSDTTKPVCTNCGSNKLQSRGLQHAITRTYKRYQCQACGRWMRSRYAEKKLTNKNILTQVFEP